MDIDALRAGIPALDDMVYLNTGATSPSPTRVVTAVENALEFHEYEAASGDGMYPVGGEILDDARRTVASLGNVASNEITLTQSTADGINIVAGGAGLGPDDDVVITDMEHPAGILPWKRFGANVVTVGNDSGRIDRDAFKDAVADAKLVCFSSISWNFGTQLPVAELVAIARDAGAITVVDAAQSFGQKPVDLTEWDADFTAGTGHKWLLGPWGSGFLHVRDGAEELLSSARIGSKSVTDFDYETGAYDYEPGAIRLQSATVSPPAYAGLAEAIELLQDVRLDAVSEQIRSLTDLLKDELDDDWLVSPREYESGLVTIESDDSEATVERLSEEGIEIRSIPFPENIRVSIHGFNTKSDIERLLSVL